MKKPTYSWKGKEISEEEYLAIPEKEYEKEVKRRRKIKFKVK